MYYLVFLSAVSLQNGEFCGDTQTPIFMTKAMDADSRVVAEWEFYAEDVSGRETYFIPGQARQLPYDPSSSVEGGMMFLIGCDGGYSNECQLGIHVNSSGGSTMQSFSLQVQTRYVFEASVNNFDSSIVVRVSLLGGVELARVETSTSSGMYIV